MNSLVTTSPELWKEIADIAQFEKLEYDLELQNEIRRKLNIPKTGNMSVLLQKYNISIEALIGALFECLMPFSEMLNDLLQMFKQADAQEGDNNLKIQFDFNKYEEIFNTDLEFFHQQAHQTVPCFKMTNLFDILNNHYTVITGLGENGGYHAQIFMSQLFSAQE